MWEIKEGYKLFVLLLIGRIIVPSITLELLEFTKNDILGLSKLSHKKLCSNSLDLLEHSLSRHSLLESSCHAVRSHDTRRSHIWMLRLAAPPEVPDKSQHQLSAL